MFIPSKPTKNLFKQSDSTVVIHNALVLHIYSTILHIYSTMLHIYSTIIYIYIQPFYIYIQPCYIYIQLFKDCTRSHYQEKSSTPEILRRRQSANVSQQWAKNSKFRFHHLLLQHLLFYYFNCSLQCQSFKVYKDLPAGYSFAC